MPDGGASEPITVVYGHGRASLMKLTMNGQNQLEKGDLAAAQRSLDTVIKADPTFYPAYYVRARVFLNHRFIPSAAKKRTECQLGARALSLCSLSQTVRADLDCQSSSDSKD
jgi:hypothetical protein